jgi:predicted MFS family arabinose efflux permease
MFFFDFGVSIYFFFFNLFLSGRGYSEAQLGLLTGTMAAGNLAGALPAARLIRRIGLRNALITCLAAAPVVLCARSLTPSFPVQICLAFVTGVALCIWAVCISPITAAITTERKRPLAFSLVFSLGIGIGAAGALAGSRMPGLFSQHLGNAGPMGADQLTLIAACCIAALALIPALRLGRCGGAVPTRPGPLFTPAVRRMLPAVGIWGLVTGSFAPFGNVFLATHLRLSLHSVGTVFSVSQVCQVAAVLCAPFVFRRLGLSKGIFAMQMGTAICFILLALISHPAPAGMIYVALTGLQYMGEPGLYSMMMEIVPEEARGGASASMALVLGAAQLIAAAAAGWSFTNLGYPLALSVIAMIALTAGVLFRTVAPAERRGLVPCGNGATVE